MPDILGRPFENSVEVLNANHLLRDAADAIGERAATTTAPNPLVGVKLAAYYGCLLVCPPEAGSATTTRRAPRPWTTSSPPAARKPVDWNMKVECCGGQFSFQPHRLGRAARPGDHRRRPRSRRRGRHRGLSALPFEPRPAPEGDDGARPGAHARPVRHPARRPGPRPAVRAPSASTGTSFPRHRCSPSCSSAPSSARRMRRARRRRPRRKRPPGPSRSRRRAVRLSEPYRRLRLSLRREHRPHRRRRQGRRCPQGPPRRRLHDRLQVHVLRPRAGSRPQGHRGEQPHGRRHRRLLAAHAREDVPQRCRQSGAQQVHVRDGQHPRALLVDPRGPRRSHAEGHRHRPRDRREGQAQQPLDPFVSRSPSAPWSSAAASPASRQLSISPTAATRSSWSRRKRRSAVT